MICLRRIVKAYIVFLSMVIMTHSLLLNASAATIETVAGGYPQNVPALSVNLNANYGVKVDSIGNIYICDAGYNLIRKVDTNGIIRTLAGNGERGFSGDGGPSVNAILHMPDDITVDDLGNTFFADFGNNRIRKIDTLGNITTVAGGILGPRSVKVDRSGNLFLTEAAFGKILKVDNNGIISTVAAGLNYPCGVDCDNLGNIIVSETGAHKLWKIDQNGNKILIAGTGTAGTSGDGAAAILANLYAPQDVTFRNGNIYFVDGDDFSKRIRKIDQSGIITTVAGVIGTGPEQGSYNGDGIPATMANIYPASVDVDANGNLIISDFGNKRIRKVDSQGIIWTVAGNGLRGSFSGDGGPALEAGMNNPSAVALDPVGNIYIADTENHRIRKVDSAGIITTVATTGNAMPTGIATDSYGNVYFPNEYSLQKLDTEGTITTLFLGSQINSIRAVTTDFNNNVYFISDRKVFKRDAAGTITHIAGTDYYPPNFNGDGISATAANLGYPTDIAVDTAGNLFIADSYHQRIRKVGTNGIITTVSTGMSYPFGVAADAYGNIFATGGDVNNTINFIKIDSQGIITVIRRDGYNSPGIDVSRDGDIYFTDRYYNLIRKMQMKAPVSIATLTGIQKENGWYASDVAVSINASDPDSLVKEIHYSVCADAETCSGDSNVVQGNSANISIAEEGVHYVVYYAVDVDTNVERQKNTSIVKIDKTAPSSSISLQGTLSPTGWYTSDVTVSINATDPPTGSGVKELHYRIDGVETVVAGSSAQVVISQDGIHAFEAWAVDNAGHMEETIESVTINKDSAAPQIVSSDPADGSTGVLISKTISVKFDDKLILKDAQQISLSYINRKGQIFYVPCTVSVNEDTVVIDPVADLDTSTNFTATISASALTDKAGNQPASPLSINFMTGKK